jgi:hypothetical protein
LLTVRLHASVDGRFARAYDNDVEQLAHWWNGSWGGPHVRRDVWVDLLDDGRYQVRWRGGEWTERDGVLWATDKPAAWAAVQELLDDAGGGEWKRVDQIEPVASSRQTKATTQPR